MKQFESRNVLDRIETTWNMFFSSAWQVRVLPQILFAAIGTTLGMISFAPLFFLFPIFMAWDTLESIGQMSLLAKTLMILLVPITIFTLVRGMVYTYTLTVSHDYVVGKTWQQYARLAWSRLWGWAWYGFWVIIMVLTLFAIGVALYFTSSVLFGFSILLLVLLYLWGVVVFYAGAPGFILDNSWSPRGFIPLFSLTSGRWWNVFGNMLLGSIVVSSMLGVVQQLIYWIMGVTSFANQLSSMDNVSEIDWAVMFTNISPDLGIRFVFGLVLLFVLMGGQKVFVTMFQYVVWHDIQTDALGIMEEKEE